MGHTYPGATAPFGMVQLSPETDTIQYSIGQGFIKDVYRYYAGYNIQIKLLSGSATHTFPEPDTATWKTGKSLSSPLKI